MTVQEAPAQDLGVDNTATISSVVAGSAVALLALYLGPILVGEYIAKLGVSDSQAGLIVTTEMAGFTIGSAALFVISGMNWRMIMTIMLSFMVVGNGVLLWVDTLFPFVISRFVAGFGAGAVMTMTIQVIAMMRDSERVYGMWTVGQLSLGAVGLLVFPSVLESGGVDTMFLIWAVLAALMFVTVRFYPTERGNGSVQPEGSGKIVGSAVVVGAICLLGLLIHNGGHAGIWVFIELIGASWGLDPAAVGNALFISLLAGIAGSAVAILVGDRLGHATPLVASVVSSCTAIVILLGSGGLFAFTVSVCLFNFGWYLFLPYLSAVIAVLDTNGKLLTALAVVFPAALAVGPAVAAVVLGNSESMLPVVIYGLVSVPVGLALVLPASNRSTRVIRG